MSQKNIISHPWERIIFKSSITVLILSGLAQMPLFKRYYIADFPGFAWTADYHFNHVLHYIAAAVMLFITAKWALTYTKKRKNKIRLSISGSIRVSLFLIIIISGFFRAVKNLPEFYFSPVTTTAIIWIHLAAGAILGIIALYARLAGKNYTTSFKSKADFPA